MRVPLPVLGVLLLCLAVAGAQEAPRGRGRLRDLVQRARAGDTEAQALLASRRRKVVRKNEAAGGRGREQSAVAAILGGAAPAAPAAPAPATRTRGLLARTRARGEALSTRSRSRGGVRNQVDVTTFRPRALPSFPTTTVTTEAPTQPPPPPVQENFVEQTEELPPTTEVDLTLTDVIPSMFQSAQFGPGGRGVQAGAQSIVRPSRPVSRDFTPAPARPVSRPRERLPHRAIQRGLETGSRSEVINQVDAAREDETPRAPPIQTTRRYSYFDEAGNYVFGYEAEDGSFKEEVRGKDCIVNGKYGYVDPDGIRREFTYVSGNKCDPNNPDSALLPDGTPIPTGDQFLHQTQEQALTEAELSALPFNRRRRPTQSASQGTTVQQRPSVARTRVSRPRTRPTPQPQQFSPRPAAPEPERFSPRPAAPEPERFSPRPAAPEPASPVPKADQTADLTPSGVIPSMFQPAQFGAGGRGVQPSQDRFPVPDFLSSSSRSDSSSRRGQERTRAEEAPRRSEAPRRPEPPRQVQQEERPRIERPRQESPPAATPVDLTPTNVIPSLFQPAQFGAGGRGVQQVNPVTRPPVNFNFDQEFQSVFSHFDGAGAPTLNTRPAPRPPRPQTPRPTPRPPPPPTTRPPPPSPPPAPRSNNVPSLFQPAQFGSSPPAPPRPRIEDNALTLSNSGSSASGGHQLVFDASTGTFKTVQLQSNNHFSAPSHSSSPQASRPPPPRPATPAPRPPTQPPRRPPPPPPSQGGGRPLPLFGTSGSSSKNPLPPIPTSAAEFDRFFAQFPTAG